MPRSAPKTVAAKKSTLSSEEQELLKKAIDGEAHEVIVRLANIGCFSCMMFCSFRDDEGNLHFQSGGNAPMPPVEFLKRQLKLFQKAEKAGRVSIWQPKDLN